MLKQEIQELLAPIQQATQLIANQLDKIKREDYPSEQAFKEARANLLGQIVAYRKTLINLTAKINASTPNLEIYKSQSS